MTNFINRSTVANALEGVLFKVRKERPLPIGDFESFEIIHDLKLDSLQRIEMVMIAEEEFDMALQDTELAKCITVSQVVDVLCRQLDVD